jgi:hypothetical protein
MLQRQLFEGLRAAASTRPERQAVPETRQIGSAVGGHLAGLQLAGEQESARRKQFDYQIGQQEDDFGTAKKQDRLATGIAGLNVGLTGLSGWERIVQEREAEVQAEQQQRMYDAMKRILTSYPNEILKILRLEPQPAAAPPTLPPGDFTPSRMG